MIVASNHGGAYQVGLEIDFEHMNPDFRDELSPMNLWILPSISRGFQVARAGASRIPIRGSAGPGDEIEGYPARE
jgi:hypothetical protein